MKRVNNLYDEMCSYEKLKEIYRTIKSKCKNYNNLTKFDVYENINLYNILIKLYLRKYDFKRYHIFLISEPKYRLIMSECIEDKIVNHLISRYVLIPALEKKLIDTNVATRKGLGSGAAFNYLISYLNKLLLVNKNVYVLKVDIRKYFYNVDHNILKDMLKNDIKDKDALDIVFKVLDSTNDLYVNKWINKAKLDEIRRVKSLNISDYEKELKIKEIEAIPLYKYNKGLSIGNMTSQLLAIYYLNNLDHFIKEKLKCKYYIRYMDDLIIIDSNKDRLVKVLDSIKLELIKYKLEINPKSQIYSLNHGFNFLGYSFKFINNKLCVSVYNQTKRKINHNLRFLYKNNLDKFYRSLASYNGFFLKCNCCVKLYNENWI